ncbi:MAG: molybdenum cofactor biosynthesis protein MoaE [Deinococcales bacterium]
MTTAVPAASDDDFLIGPEAIDVAALLHAAAAPAFGAVASFLGSVRSPNAGDTVRHIDYEGYEAMMRAEMQRLTAEIRSRHTLGRVFVAHRLGRLHPGDVSLAVVVSSAHRGEALAALEALVEGLKARLPVWKYEVSASGERFVAGRSDAGPTL